MSATEVYARENERVMLFSPSFTLFASDFQPLMERVFALLFRLGRFPQPPATVLSKDPIGEDVVEVPHVIYQGRIAQVMRRLQSEGIERTLQRLQTLSGLDAGICDHVDLDRAFRLSARLDGVPEDILRSQTAVRRLRRQREQQLAAITQAQQQLTPPQP